MSVVLVGLSHRTAPVSLLERATVPADELAAVVARIASSPHVAGAVLVSTCNRTEVYADVRAFHAGVGEMSALFSALTGESIEELTPHLYVHYEDRAAQHLFEMVCGLDSMVVGEGQILGQVRDSLRVAQDAAVAGTTLNELMQFALRVGKRAHTETGIDLAASALVTTALDRVRTTFPDRSLAGRSALVVGAGAMSSIAVAALRRAEVADLVVANRSVEHAERLALAYDGRAVPLAGLADAVAQADLVVSCTGAAGYVLSQNLVEQAIAARPDRPLALVDLALPRDIDPGVRDLPVTLVDLTDLGQLLEETAHSADVAIVRSIVADEVAGYLSLRQSARVAPTVVALRSMADEVVVSELARFDSRIGTALDADSRAEVERTVRRVVDKLLHAPTVRVKELAAEPAGLAYADALHALFDLDPARYREVVIADVHIVETDTSGEALL